MVVWYGGGREHSIVFQLNFILIVGLGFGPVTCTGGFVCLFLKIFHLKVSRKGRWGQSEKNVFFPKTLGQSSGSLFSGEWVFVIEKALGIFHKHCSPSPSVDPEGKSFLALHCENLVFLKVKPTKTQGFHTGLQCQEFLILTLGHTQSLATCQNYHLRLTSYGSGELWSG